MRKIITGFLGIMLVVGLVSGTAFAVYSDTVPVNGISITAGDGNLQIWDGVSTYVENLNLAFSVTNAFPGYSTSKVINLRNSSTSNIGLDLTGQLTTASGDWGDLKDKVFLEIQENSNPANTTTAKSLSDWNAGAVGLLPNLLSQGANRDYKLIFSVSLSAGNEIFGKSLSDITLNFVGTQP